MKIKSDNAWKMLIPLPGTEKILVNVDPLLTIDVLTQLWPTGGPRQKSPSILFPIPPNPGSNAIATGGRGAMILTGLHWAHARPVGGDSSQVPHATQAFCIHSCQTAASRPVRYVLSCNGWKVCSSFFCPRRSCVPATPQEL